MESTRKCDSGGSMEWKVHINVIARVAGLEGHINVIAGIAGIAGIAWIARIAGIAGLEGTR